MMPISTKPKQQHSVMFADLGPRPAPKVDEEDDGSISSASSSSESKEFVEDSTTETGASTSKRSHTTSTTNITTNWFDDNMNATKSSTLVLALVVATSIILGSITFAVSKKQDEDAFHNKVSASNRFQPVFHLPGSHRS